MKRLPEPTREAAKPAEPREATPVERPALEPPTYSIKALLISMSLLCALFGVYAAFGLNAVVVVSFFMLTVLAHVAGNSLGTRLRDIGNLPQPHDTPVGKDFTVRRRSVAQSDFAPSTRLRDRYSLGLPIIITTTIGAVVGAAAGGALLALWNREQGSIMTIVVGALAFGILGGIWTFVASSFLQVAGGAFVQAIKGRAENE